jgi:hypothetical protein
LGSAPGMDQQQKEAFEAAVERKKAESEARSHDSGPAPDGGTGISGDQHSLISDDRKTQDVRDVRKKNSGKGHKTADKWNQ